MESFSWSDGVRAAVASCLPCFSSSRSEDETNLQTSDRQRSSANRQQQQQQRRLRPSQYDELEGLLGDVLVESDVDAETVSLRSNFGGGRNRKKKGKRQRDGRTKHIRVFGFDLFGRPPIQLPESDEEENNGRRNRGNRNGTTVSSSSPGTITAASSSTEAFDSDASPLDPSTLDRLSPQDALRLAEEAQREQAALEAEARRVREEKEERRRRRRERRELRRAAAGMGVGDEEFEGFQGSGPGVSVKSGLVSPGSSTMDSSSVAGASATGSGGDAQESFGPFVTATSARREASSGDDPESGLADFGGDAYARKTRSRTGNGNSDGSRSVTSATLSNPDSAQAQSFNHHYLSQTQPRVQAQVRTLADLPRKKSKRKSLAAVAATISSSPTSQSASLPSPVDSPVDFDRRFAPMQVQIAAQQQQQDIVVHNQPPFAQPMIVSPGLQGQFEGFPQQEPVVAGVPTSGFPAVGFGGVRRKSVDASAFLALQGNMN